MTALEAGVSWANRDAFPKPPRRRSILRPAQANPNLQLTAQTQPNPNLKTNLMFLPKPLLPLLVIAALAGPSLTPGHAQPGNKKISIAVIPKGTTQMYWKGVEAGARQAAKELGIDMVWKGPLLENDRAQQIQIVEQFVSEGKSGIVLAPLDDTALKRPVAEAMARHIPVVIIDSGLKGEVGKDFISYVSTDNRGAGRMAGEELARLVGENGKVILMRYMEGQASTTEREEG